MIMQDLCYYMQSQGTDLSSLRTYNQVFVTHCSFVFFTDSFVFGNNVF